MKLTTLILDRGHATLDKDGNYETKGKQWKFPDGLHVYEGYENQKYIERLAYYAQKAGLEVVYTVKPLDPKDVSLEYRVTFANSLKNRDTSLFLSIHNNAGGGEGTEVFTSIGQTKSDIYAEQIINNIMKDFPNRKMRIDTRDGDKDKEENFYVLRRTSMPAVLMEYGFFDNRKDYEWLSNPCNIDKLAQLTINGIIEASKFI